MGALSKNIRGDWSNSLGSEICIDSGYLGVLEKIKQKGGEGGGQKLFLWTIRDHIFFIISSEFTFSISSSSTLALNRPGGGGGGQNPPIG